MRVARSVLLLVAAVAVVPATPTAAQPFSWPTEVRIGAGRITLDYAALGGPRELRLDSARLRSERDGQILALRGALDGLPVAVTARLAPAAPARPVTVDVELAGVTARAVGRVHGGALDLSLSARDDGGGVRQFLPGLPLDGPIALDARIRRQDDRILGEDLRLVAAGGTVRGQFELVPGDPPRLKGSLQGDAVTLGDRATGRRGGGGGSPDSVFSRDPLPLPGLGRLDLELDLMLGRLTLSERIRLHDVQATLLTAGRRARLSADAISFAGSTYRLRAVLDETGAEPAVSLDLTSEDADLGAFVALWGAPGLFDARGRIKIDVIARGTSPHALARSLNGRAAAYFVNGRINADAAGAPIVGAQRFLGLIGAAPRREWVAMPCLVMRLDAVDGVIRPEVLLVDTARATTIGEGKVDLREERWALTLTPQPKGLDLSLGVPVRITGPLAAPRVGLDEARLAGTVGRLIGTAILFPPGLLADAFIGVVPSDPCGQILQRGVQRVTPRQVPGQGVVDGVTQGLRNLFGR